MSRQLEILLEERATARNASIIKAVEYELSGSVGHTGGTLVGLAIKFEDFECLLTLKATFEGKRMVAFIVADDFGTGLLRAVRAAYSNKLRWRADRYARSDV